MVCSGMCLRTTDEKLCVHGGHCVGWRLVARNSNSNSNNVPMTDIGKLFKYLDYMCRCRNPSPRGLCFNDNEFVVATYSEGTLQSVYRGLWTTAGCIEAIRNYLEVDAVNGTVQGLFHFLRHHPGSQVHLALGRGRFGCVFKVSLPPSEQPFALKILSTDAGNEFAEEEYQKLLSMGNAYPHLVARAIRDSFVSTEAFCYYGIADLGNHGDNVSIPARATFMKLLALHASGVLHGDPRIANIIQLPDGSLRWIDLRHPPGNVAEDVGTFVRSVFGDGVANHVQVQERILEYRAEVSEGGMTSIYDLCRHLTASI